MSESIYELYKLSSLLEGFVNWVCLIRAQWELLKRDTSVSFWTSEVKLDMCLNAREGIKCDNASSILNRAPCIPIRKILVNLTHKYWISSSQLGNELISICIKFAWNSKPSVSSLNLPHLGLWQLFFSYFPFL